MVEEAMLEDTGSGLAPAGDGWFVVNLADAHWRRHDAFGAACRLEGEKVEFPHFGVNVRVLWPGQPNCMYHAELEQEGFLVLAGECLLLVEGHERRLRAWDFAHCPPWTEHVFVGAGDGPCAILMIGARGRPDSAVRYPVSGLAQRHGASVEAETTDWREAYARYPRSRPERLPDLGFPWQ